MGERVTDILNCRLSFSLAGGLKVNFWIREVIKMNSSDLANCSPRQARFPVRQKQQDLFSCHRYVTNYLLQSLNELWDWDLVASMHLCLASALSPQNTEGKSAGSQIA